MHSFDDLADHFKKMNAMEVRANVMILLDMVLKKPHIYSGKYLYHFLKRVVVTILKDMYENGFWPKNRRLQAWERISAPGRCVYVIVREICEKLRDNPPTITFLLGHLKQPLFEILTDRRGHDFSNIVPSGQMLRFKRAPVNVKPLLVDMSRYGRLRLMATTHR